MKDSSNEESRFAPTKWYVIDSQTAKDKYNQNRSIKFETEIIKSSLFAHSDAFIVFTGDITVTGDNDTNVPLKNCATISTCKAEINDVFIDEANHTYIEMPKFNLIEYMVIIQTHQDVHGSFKEMKSQLIMLIDSWLFSMV